MVQTTTLANGIINLAVRAAALRRGATQSANSLRSVQRRSRALAAQQRRTNAAFRSFIQRLGTLRGIVGVLAGAGGLIALTKSAADTGAELSELRTRTGIAVDELQVLQRVLEGDGLAAAQFDRFINNLTRRIGEAHDGLATYKDLFDELGVAVTTTNGEQRNTLDVFRDLLTAFPAMENESRRLAIATELLGNRQVAALTTFLRGPEAFDRSAAAMRRLGVITDEQADRLKLLQQGFIDTSNAVRAAFFVGIANAAGEIDNLNKNLRETIIEAIPGFISGVQTLVEHFGALVDVLKALIALGISAAIVRMATAVRTLSRAMLGLNAALGIFGAINIAVFLIIDNLDLVIEGFRRLGSFLQRWWINFQTTILQGLLETLNLVASGFDLIGLDTIKLDRDISFAQNRLAELGRQLEALNETPAVTTATDEPGGGSTIPTFDVDRINEANTATQELIGTQMQLSEQQSVVANSATNAIVGIVDGTTSLSDAFKDTARSIIADLFRIQVRALIVRSILGAFGGGGTDLLAAPTNTFGFLPGGVQQGGYVGSDRIVRVGEAGPEVVRLPGGSRVQSTRRVTDSPTTINFNIASTDGPGVQAAIAQAAPLLTNLAVQAVERRGEQQAVF